jgi:hypothetical protein
MTVLHRIIARVGNTTLSFAVLGLAGCQLPGVLDQRAVGWSTTASLAGGVFAAAPRIAKAVHKDDGMAHTTVHITIEDGNPVKPWQLLNVAGTWTGAVVSLADSAVLTSAWTSPSIPRASFTGPFTDPVTGFTTALKSSITLPPLRPDPGYTAGIVLQDNTAGTGLQLTTTRLAGSKSNAVALKSGNNDLSFVVQANTNDFIYDVQAGSSTNNNIISSNSIVPGDTVTLDTGMLNAATWSGVSKLNVYMWGTTCYPGTTATNRVFLQQLGTPSSWATFVWNTAAAGPALPTGTFAVNPATNVVFAPATFVGPVGVTTSTAGQIDVEAVDANNTVVGKASFTINVFGTPTGTLYIE